MLGVGAIAARATSPATVFHPPYSMGAKGGDQWNTVVTDANGGRVTVARAYPVAGAFNCASAGGFATLRIAAVVTGPITSVAVAADQLVADNYTWVTVLVRDAAGRWLGGTKRRGPATGRLLLTAPVQWTPALVGTRLTVDVGIETASACPNVDGGTARFPSITVNGSVTKAPAAGGSTGGGGGGGGGGAIPVGVVTTANFSYTPGRPGLVAGTRLTFVNADVDAPHTVTAVALDRNGRALFDSGAPVNAGGIAAVIGTEKLRPGAYAVFCRVPTQMRGTLPVVACRGDAGSMPWSG